MSESTSTSSSAVKVGAAIAVAAGAALVATWWFQRSNRFVEDVASTQEQVGEFEVNQLSKSKDSDIFFWAAQQLREKKGVPKILILLRDLSGSDKVKDPTGCAHGCCR